MKCYGYLCFGLILLGLIPQTLAQELPIGTWQGLLEVPRQQLRLVIHIEGNTEDGYTGTLDSPDQGAKGLPLDTVAFAKGHLYVELLDGAASYQGEYDSEQGQFVGTFSQSGMKFDLNLGKEKLVGPARPQTPQEPFPYQVEEVDYPNSEAEIRLAATLTLPEGNGPHPAVILISGSGPQDRDETIFNHKPFWVIADYLSRQGWAVLRYDDRGVGESTGDFGAATSADFATDVQAGLTYLSSREDIDTTKLGLMGHSEGGLIAPMVAAQDKDLAFIVLLAGPGMQGGDLLILQQEKILTGLGIDQAVFTRWNPIRDQIHALILSEPDPEKAMTKLKAQATSLLAPLSAGDKEVLGITEENLVEQFGILNSPWFRYFLTFEPAPYLKQVSCPVLAINGSKDLQVPSEENLAGIRTALEAGGNTQITIQELPGLNHLFQPTDTGLPNEYAQIEETFSPTALKVIGDWLGSVLDD